MNYSLPTGAVGRKRERHVKQSNIGKSLLNNILFEMNYYSHYETYSGRLLKSKEVLTEKGQKLKTMMSIIGLAVAPAASFTVWFSVLMSI